MQINTASTTELPLAKNIQPSSNNERPGSSFNELLENANDTVLDKTMNISTNFLKKSNKPNMRELMEALSGKDLESLYGQNDNEWKEIAKSAHTILYGVLGDKDDTRDWRNILTSENVLTNAREETAKLHGVKIEVERNKNIEISEHEYVGVIKDNKDAALRYLVGSENYIRESIESFGTKKQAISEEFLKKLAGIDIDPKLQNSLDRIITSELTS